VSGYVRSTPFEGEFAGEKVTAELLPLTFVDLVRLESAIKVGDADLARIHTDILPRYVKNMQGVKAADGSDVTIDEVASAAYFFELASTLGARIAEAATPPPKPSVPSAS
jgi:hypothetical protein